MTITPHTSRLDSDGYRVITYDPPSEEAVEAAIKEAAALYKEVFGRRLASVWLYGSRARGDHKQDSDIDLLVVLHEQKPMYIESPLLVSVSQSVRKSFGVFIDGQPTTLNEFENSDDDFHYFVRTEGQRIDV